MEALASLADRPAAEVCRVLERWLRDGNAERRRAALSVGAEVLQDESLVAMLRDGADPVRRNGGLEMLKRRGQRAIPLATRLLDDSDPDVVLQAAMALSVVGDQESRMALAGMLAHDNPNIVQAAIAGLGRAGVRAVPLLVPFLDGDDWLRIAAVEALGDIGGDAATAAIEPMLRTPLLVQTSARALARCGTDRACRALADWLEASDARDPVPWEALADALERPGARLEPGETLKTILGRRIEGGSLSAARCALHLRVTEIEPAALDVLVTQAKAWSPFPACLSDREDLAPVLLEHGGVSREWGLRLAARFPQPDLVSFVAAALTDAAWRLPPDVIAQAVMALDDPALAPAIMRCYAALPTSSRAGWGPVLAHYRQAIVRALPAHDPLPGDAGQMLGTLVEDPAVAAAAIEALPAGARLEAIAAAMERPDVLRRLPWLEWLVTAPAVYGPLATAAAEAAGLRSELPRIRALLRQSREPTLVRLIGALRDTESIPLLIGVLQDAEPGLRVTVLAAMGRIGGPEARRTLRPLAASAAGDRFVYRALAACAEPADLPLLREGLRHSDWHVRLVCLEALGSQGGLDDRARLAALCGDPVPPVAACAQKWLAA
jgi:HEAT repeat protein